jgi:hypothetical protein
MAVGEQTGGCDAGGRIKGRGRRLQRGDALVD